MMLEERGVNFLIALGTRHFGILKYRRKNPNETQIRCLCSFLDFSVLIMTLQKASVSDPHKKNVDPYPF